MWTANAVWSFLGQVVAYGGGAAVIAYLLFQYLGKTWIENKFAERLDQLRHQQAMELQRLRVEIDALLSGAIKLQEKEFDVLPEAWAKLDEAHSLVGHLVARVHEYADLSKMNAERLDEFLGDTDFTPTQKDEIRKSHDRNRTYQELVFWHRLHRVRAAFAALQTFVARNGIFLPPELKQKFEKMAQALWSAIASKQVGHESKDWNMQREGWQTIQEQTEPLYKAIEADIHCGCGRTDASRRSDCGRADVSRRAVYLLSFVVRPVTYLFRRLTS
jgi:hypothetical protein